MTGWCHDATALYVAFSLFPPSGDPTGVAMALVCIGSLGLWEVAERTRQAHAIERAKDVLRRRGERHPEPLPSEFSAVRWRGPRKGFTRPLRLLAMVAAAGTSLVLGLALACARLPDQLEVGPIDHRKLTHYLVTAAGVIYGAWYGSTEFVPASAGDITRGVATGYLVHLVMDCFTRSGVALFWPVWRQPIHLLPRRWPAWVLVRVPAWLRGWLGRRRLRVKTGGLVDAVVMLVALGGVALAVRG